MISKRIIAVITASLTCLSLLACSVFTSYGERQKGSISLDYELSDTLFSLYKVGDITASGFVADEAFEQYHVDLSSENAANTLMAYIVRDRHEPLASIRTDSNCSAVFDDLDKGVYLLTGESSTVNDVFYTVMPSLISLPSNDGASVNWDVNAVIKFSKTGVIGRLHLNCVKIWKDDGDTIHPEVHVELLRDGEVYDVVALNEDNNWKYSWYDLDPDSHWIVTEEELDGSYSVDISRSDYTFTIVNTINDGGGSPSEPTSPSTSPTSSTSPSDSGTVPSGATTSPTGSPATPSEVKSSDAGASGTIPQTGQLNWPIPVLAGAGIVLCLIGVLLLRKKSDKDE